VKPGRVKLSIAWSNAPGESLDKTVSGLAVWAWQDTAACIENPGMVGYKPHSPQASMVEAFKTRWVHGINTQTPGTIAYMKDHYKGSQPWFIGEYGANGLGQAEIENELRHMDSVARDSSNPFLGMAFFQFQTAYFKGGSEMNFGLFRFGNKKLGETGDICDQGHGCKKLPVWCLTTDRGDLPDIVSHRADALAKVWGGAIDQSQMC